MWLLYFLFVYSCMEHINLLSPCVCVSVSQRQQSVAAPLRAHPESKHDRACSAVSQATFSLDAPTLKILKASSFLKSN